MESILLIKSSSDTFMYEFTSTDYKVLCSRNNEPGHIKHKLKDKVAYKLDSYNNLSY